MGIPVLAGRAFTADDTPTSQPVAIISRKAADQLWPGENPVGSTVSYKVSGKTEPEVRQIVGVVGDTVGFALQSDLAAGFYVPHSQSNRASALQIMVRVEEGMDAAALGSQLRARLASIDNRLSTNAVGTMRSEIGARLARLRFLTVALAVFAGLALLLTITAVGGVVAYLVRARTYEFGVRLALGARPSSVLALILGYGARLAMLGIVLGTGGAWMLTRLVKSFLYQVEPRDALTMTVAPAVILLAVLGACYLPGRRAMRIDPAQALRAE